MKTINTRELPSSHPSEDYKYCWIKVVRTESVARVCDFYFYMDGALTRMTNKQYTKAGCVNASNPLLRDYPLVHVYLCLMHLMKEHGFEKVVFLTNDE